MKLNLGYLLLITLLVVIIAITNYQPGTLLTGGDNLHPEFNPLLSIKRSLFAVWQEYQGVGLLGGMGHAADLVRQVFVLILSLFIPLENIRYTTTFIYLFTGVFGTYFLLRKILRPFSPVFPLVGAAFYLLNLATVQAFYVPFEAFEAHFAFLPWLFWGTVHYFQNPSGKSALLLGAILLLATPAAYVPTLFLVFILSTIVLVPFLLPGSALRIKFLRAGKFYLIIFIINAFWLLSFLYFAATSSSVVTEAKINQMSSETNFLKNKEFGTIFDAALLRGFWFNNTDFNLNQDQVFLMQPWREYLGNPIILGVGYLLFAIVVTGVIRTARERGPKAALGFLGVLIFSFAMLATDTPPFSWLNSILRQNPFFAEAFRFPFTKFSILLSLTYSIFFAFGLIYISGAAKRFVSIPEKFLMYGPALASFALLFAFAFPIFRGNLFYEKARVKFPAEYRELFEFFKKQDKNTRIASFPQHTFWSWDFYKWGYSGSGFLWYGIEQPILDRAFDPWSRGNENYYWEISYALYSRKQELFEKVFEKYQINWVLVDGNVINPSSPKALFLDELEKIFSASDKFRLAADFGKIKAYRVQLDTPVNNFVYLAQNLPTVEPVYKWGNYDAAFQEHGHYIFQDSPPAPRLRQAGKFQILDSIIYPFRSLFTGKRQEDIEFDIEEKENSFVFSKTFARPLQNYSLKIPEIDTKGLTFINPYDLASQKFLHPDVFFDGMALVVEIPKIKGYLSEQIDPAYDASLAIPKNCSNFENGTAQNEITKEKDSLFLRLVSENANNCSASFFLPNLPHGIGYLITAAARHRQGKSLLFWLENLNTRKADIETYLPRNAKRKTQNDITTSYFTQPPMEKDGVGYSLHFDNISIGNEKTVNDLGKITINLIPYEFLTQITLEPIPGRTENSVFILSQAYNQGWSAYIPNSKFQILNSKFLLPIFGKRIENHVLVDNWANGWIMDSDRDGEIVIVFWPQYLEYLGFFVLFAYFFLLASPKLRGGGSFLKTSSLLIHHRLWYTKTKMADTDNKTLKDIIKEEDEGRHEHNPSQSPAVQDEEEASGSSPSPTADDDIDKMVEEVTGQKPESGKTFNEIINEAEAGRRGPPKDPEPKEEI